MNEKMVNNSLLVMDPLDLTPLQPSSNLKFLSLLDSSKTASLIPLCCKIVSLGLLTTTASVWEPKRGDFTVFPLSRSGTLPSPLKLCL